MIIRFNIICSWRFLLLHDLSRLAFITFFLVSFRRYLQFYILSFDAFYLSTFFPSTFCIIQCFVRRRFFTVGVFYNWPRMDIIQKEKDNDDFKWIADIL